MKHIAPLLCLMLLASTSAFAQGTASCRPSPLHPVFATHLIPPYPTLSMQFGEEGNVTLLVTLDTSGTPTDVSVIKSSGALRLDAAAAEYIKAKWKWQAPIGTDCKPIRAVTPVAVNWHLETPSDPISLHYDEMDMTPADYPAGALTRGEQGFVGMQVTLSPDGSVAKATVTIPSKYPDLDDQSLDIVKARFHGKPGEMNGNSALPTLGVIAVWTPPLPDSVKNGATVNSMIIQQ